SGTGQYVVNDQHWPEAVETTSNIACAESPSFSARRNASDTAIIDTPRIMLLQILAACPAPTSPQWMTRLPTTPSRNGLAASNAALLPPHMMVSVPALAPLTPPETGASRDRQRLAPAIE